MKNYYTLMVSSFNINEKTNKKFHEFFQTITMLSYFFFFFVFFKVFNFP